MIRNYSILVSRVALALFIGLLIVWLIKERSPDSARRKAISDAIRRGSIGTLSSEEARYFRGMVTWLAKQSAPGTEIAINEPPDPNKLNFYSTSAETQDITGCSRGNAVYDVALDAVFVDKELIQTPTFQTTQDETPIFIQPANKVYLCFIILHELGHRKLHRSSGSMFDFASYRHDSRLLTQEKEADAYALQTMIAGYSADFNAVVRYIGDLSLSYTAADLPLENAVPIPRPEKIFTDPMRYYKVKVLQDLAAMASTMSFFKLFSASPFSPYYVDPGHPAFIDRAMGIVDQALTDDLDGEIRSQLISAKEKLIALAGRISDHYLVVVAPSPIDSLVFGESHLYVLTDTMSVFALDLSPANISSRVVGGHTVELDSKDLYAIADPRIEHSTLWYCSGLGLLALGNNGEIYQLNGRAWSLKSVLTRTDSSEFSFYLPPQPSTRVFAFLPGDHNSNSMQIYGIQSEHSITREVVEIAKEIERLGGPSNSTLKLAATTEQELFFNVFEHPSLSRWVFRGVARIEASTLRAIAFEPVGIKWEGEDTADFQGYVLPEANISRFLFTHQETPEESGGWVTTIFDMRATGYPSNFTALASHRFQVKETAFPFGGTDWVPGKGALVNFDGDSVYLLDPSTGKASVEFHPGGVWTSIGRGGEVAVYYPIGGSKAYVINH